MRLLIHQSLAGCVIGKGGQKIKEIRDVSRNVGNDIYYICLVCLSVWPSISCDIYLSIMHIIACILWLIIDKLGVGRKDLSPPLPLSTASLVTLSGNRRVEASQARLPLDLTCMSSLDTGRIEWEQFWDACQWQRRRNA